MKKYTVLSVSNSNKNVGAVEILLTMFIFKLSESPHIKSHPAPLVTAQPYIGERVQMSCRATGDPVPRVRWSKDGGLIGNGNVENKIHGNDLTSRLTIESVQPSDEGNYTCAFSNQLNQTAKATTRLGEKIYVSAKLKNSNYMHAISLNKRNLHGRGVNDRL
jgi:hypothetical protein